MRNEFSNCLAEEDAGAPRATPRVVSREERAALLAAAQLPASRPQ